MITRLPVSIIRWVAGRNNKGLNKKKILFFYNLDIPIVLMISLLHLVLACSTIGPYMYMESTILQSICS